MWTREALDKAISTGDTGCRSKLGQFIKRFLHRPTIPRHVYTHQDCSFGRLGKKAGQWFVFAATGKISFCHIQLLGAPLRDCSTGATFVVYKCCEKTQAYCYNRENT